MKGGKTPERLSGGITPKISLQPHSHQLASLDMVACDTP
jgi:hypothetical protein